MSTVVWYNRKFYADTQTTNYTQGQDGSTTINSTVIDSKLFRMDNRVFAHVGNVRSCEEFFKWVEAGQPRFFYWGPTSYSVIGEWDGKNLIFWHAKEVLWKIRGLEIFSFSYWRKQKIVKLEEGDYYYMGSGGQYASDALKAGLTPVEAIQYASDRDSFTNDRVEVVSMEDVKFQHLLPDDKLDELLLYWKIMFHVKMLEMGKWWRTKSKKFLRNFSRAFST